MKMLLNGQWTDSADTMEVDDPHDGRIIDTVPRATAEDMDAAIAAAQTGFEAARVLPTHQRMSILNHAAEAITARHEAFARTIAEEGVKTIREARKEVTRCIETLKISAEAARRITGETIPFDQMPGSENRVGYYRRFPIGIVGALTPYNDPLNLVAHKVGPAIAAGCSIIVKPHEATPLSALKLAEVIQETGPPAGMLQVITGEGSVVGDVLVRDRRVRMLSFTGSRRVGEAILKKAGLKKFSMELGSNSPVIVMADADLDLALEASISGAFWAAGQNCLHVQRLYLQDTIYDDFALRFAAAAEAYRTGDKLDEATDMGPMISESEARRVEAMVKEAVARGARILAGGTRSGAHYAPTVIAGAPSDGRLLREEIFGPVTVLARFHDLDEAIRCANDVDYGLQAAIFTRDLETAFKAGAELECGGVMINDSTDYRIDAMPFGGVKGSGLGREGIDFTLAAMTEPKVLCFNL